MRRLCFAAGILFIVPHWKHWLCSGPSEKWTKIMQNFVNTTVENVTFSNVFCNSTAENNCSTRVPHEAEITGLSVNLYVHLTQSIIGSFGVVSNAIVILVFAFNKSYRKKIPIMFMINQVRVLQSTMFLNVLSDQEKESYVLQCTNSENDCCGHLFQSSIDFTGALFSLLDLTVKDSRILHTEGGVAELECRLWNSAAFLWSFLCASTWNLACLTVERYTERWWHCCVGILCTVIWLYHLFVPDTSKLFTQSGIKHILKGHGSTRWWLAAGWEDLLLDFFTPVYLPRYLGESSQGDVEEYQHKLRCWDYYKK